MLLQHTVLVPVVNMSHCSSCLLLSGPNTTANLFKWERTLIDHIHAWQMCVQSFFHIIYSWIFMIHLGHVSDIRICCLGTIWSICLSVYLSLSCFFGIIYFHILNTGSPVRLSWDHEHEWHQDAPNPESDRWWCKWTVLLPQNHEHMCNFQCVYGVFEKVVIWIRFSSNKSSGDEKGIVQRQRNR